MPKEVIAFVAEKTKKRQNLQEYAINYLTLFELLSRMLLYLIFARQLKDCSRKAIVPVPETAVARCTFGY